MPFVGDSHKAPGTEPSLWACGILPTHPLHHWWISWLAVLIVSLPLASVFLCVFLPQPLGSPPLPHFIYIGKIISPWTPCSFLLLFPPFDFLTCVLQELQLPDKLSRLCWAAWVGFLPENRISKHDCLLEEKRKACRGIQNRGQEFSFQAASRK